MLERLLPDAQKPWAGAIEAETGLIEDDGEALAFALESLAGLLPWVLSHFLMAPFLASTSHGAAIRPRAVGFGCATAATWLGIVYMGVSGAPMRYLISNLAALLLGGLALAAFGVTVSKTPRWQGMLNLAMGCGLLLTALFGYRMDGVARWIDLGHLLLQPSFIFLPVLIVSFARASGGLSLAGVVIAATALALQPDRAMACVLAAGLAVRVATHADRYAVLAFIASLAAFIATLVQPDTLPATPYVEKVLFAAFNLHPLSGLAVLGGFALLIVPAALGGRYDKANGDIYLTFGAVWLTALIASVLGNYPTPVVGYGGSAILGYVLSLWLLPKAPSRNTGTQAKTQRQLQNAPPPDRHLNSNDSRIAVVRAAP
ncbi:hypothetical protein AEAC466_09065 [Asticcacaulis sp. AC466]|uniref:hypothetical protein n=1 Tax=Asticcacaulis sp. AC466 TaxID=1282362 RepID=UPI0003C3E246|nr:hypothetical protein [Asticcacaulis sp. AC466]ESQ84491.1 hypothetical protein AEAC466_09065 [Asticcacaulis sp. AC466]